MNEEFSDAEIDEILNKPNVKKAIKKVNDAHQSTDEFPNLFGSASHLLNMKGTLKRYFKGIDARGLIKVASIGMKS